MDMASADAEERFRQYKQLTEFCRTAFYDAEGAAIVAHHGFADGADFERQLTEHARKWIVRELEKAGEHELRPRWTSARHSGDFSRSTRNTRTCSSAARRRLAR